MRRYARGGDPPSPKPAWRAECSELHIPCRSRFLRASPLPPRIPGGALYRVKSNPRTAFHAVPTNWGRAHRLIRSRATLADDTALAFGGEARFCLWNRRKWRRPWRDRS